MALTDKLTAIAEAIRAKTGESDLLTLDAMVTAINGISGGGTGNLTIVSGTFTPTEDTTECRITGLAGSPSAFALAPAFSDQEAYNGVAKLLAFIWVRGVWALFRTNAGGTSGATDAFDAFDFESFAIEEDNYSTSANYAKVVALKTGFFARRGAYYFRAGLTYNWVAII